MTTEVSSLSSTSSSSPLPSPSPRDPDSVALDEYLRGLYYSTSNPASYGGLNNLWNYVKTDTSAPFKVTKEQVAEWLTGQNVYTLHKKAPLRFPRQRIIPTGLDELWESDLADFSAISKYNDNWKFLAIFIDVFSKFAWVRKMKNKTAREMLRVTKSVFPNSEHRQPKPYLFTDRGREYENNLISNFLKEQGVVHYVSNNELHCPHAERLVRTLKSRLYKIFTSRQSYRYVDVLEDVVDAYNHTVHSTTKMRPADVTADNWQQLWFSVYMPKQIQEQRDVLKTKPKFSVGNLVRLSLLRGKFDRDYHQKFSEEVFKIDKVVPSYPPRYKIIDLNGSSVQGSFYEQEMQRVELPADGYYKVEKILKTRKRGRQKQFLIRWVGYGADFDSWVSATDIRHLAAAV